MASKQQPESNSSHASSTDRGCSFVKDFGDILVARFFATSIGFSLKNFEISASEPFSIAAWPSVFQRHSFDASTVLHAQNTSFRSRATSTGFHPQLQRILNA